MPSGKLVVKVVNFKTTALPEAFDNADLYVVMEGLDTHRFATNAFKAEAEEGRTTHTCSWGQKFRFDMSGGHYDLLMYLYIKRQEQPDQLIGKGDFILSGVIQKDQCLPFCVPMFHTETGQPVGDLTLEARFFYIRSPGKTRDRLGQEHLAVDRPDTGSDDNLSDMEIEA